MSFLQPQQQKNASDVTMPNFIVQPNRVNLINTLNDKKNLSLVVPPLFLSLTHTTPLTLFTMSLGS